MAFRVLAATGLLLAATSVATAFTGQCLLEVDSTVYLNGPCNIEIRANGSFSVGAGEQSRSDFFAYVNLGPESAEATGYWNGAEAATHAHDSLGALAREGACWLNTRARICAWRAQ